MPGGLRETRTLLKLHAAIPVPVMVAGIAILVTRLLSVALQVNELGGEGLVSFVWRGAQSWGATLIFMGSQLLFLTELRCAVALMQGHNWARWCFLACQVLAGIYMFCASTGWIYPDVFSFQVPEGRSILSLLLLQKLPDLLLLLLLFLPRGSRQFYRHH